MGVWYLCVHGIVFLPSKLSVLDWCIRENKINQVFDLRKFLPMAYPSVLTEISGQRGNK